MKYALYVYNQGLSVLCSSVKCTSSQCYLQSYCSTSMIFELWRTSEIFLEISVSRLLNPLKACCIIDCTFRMLLMQYVDSEPCWTTQYSSVYETAVKRLSLDDVLSYDGLVFMVSNDDRSIPDLFTSTTLPLVHVPGLSISMTHYSFTCIYVYVRASRLNHRNSGISLQRNR